MTSTVNTEAARSALAKREPETPLDVAKADIARMKSQFELVLPPSIPAERLVRVLQTVVQLNPDLAKPASRKALLGAAMTCAQLGLDPTPAIGHAYILPFSGKPTFILGYKGAVWLAADNGVHLKANVICEHDDYDVQLGTESHIRHRLPPFEVDRGRAVAYYCVATFGDGSPPMFDVMTTAEIERIRQASPGKNSPAWRDHFDEMAKKTVLKRLSKSVPLGVKASVAIAHDGTARTDTATKVIDDVPDYSEDRPKGVDDDGVIDAEIVDDEPDLHANCPSCGAADGGRHDEGCEK
jgi:recombination protein RecT